MGLAYATLGWVLVIAGGAALALRKATTLGIGALTVAGFLLADAAVGGLARNSAHVLQNALGGWALVPTLLAVIAALVIVTHAAGSGAGVIVAGVLALGFATWLHMSLNGPGGEAIQQAIDLADSLWGHLVGQTREIFGGKG